MKAGAKRPAGQVPGCAATGGLVGIYARLSVNENGERDECLETQCGLLEGFVRENGLGDARLYLDNNESGAYFDRPGLLQLVEDIKSGAIGTVVVKDLSRLGRNNGETLIFLDFLKENRVRLVSPGDNYDSDKDDDEIIGIKTWVNEHYARDISRKVRANLKKKMRDGEYMARPHFGYLKSDLEKNRLVVDERYRGLIRNIFELYVKGWGYRALADYVQDLGVPTPSTDKNYSGAKKSDRWNEHQIRRIITSRVYCGDTVQGVSEKASFKSKKTRRLPEEKWVIVENTHEPVVTRETFELAQQIRVRRWLEGEGRKKKKVNELHLFTGFLACSACGANLVYRRKKDRPARYICGRYDRFGRKAGGCTCNYIFEGELISCLVEDIRQFAAGVSFKERLDEEWRKAFGEPGKETHEKIKRLERKVLEKKRQLKTIYLDRVKGITAENLFLEASFEIEKETAVLEAGIKRLQDENAAACGLDRYIHKANGLELQIDPEDIDRVFLEKYIRKIIVIGEEMGIIEEVRQKYRLGDIFTGKELEEITGKKVKLLVLYNIKHAPPG